MQGVDVLGVCERELSGEILVAGKKCRKGVSAEVGGQHHIHNGLCKGLDVTDEARTALVKDQDNGLTGRGGCLYKLFLVCRKIEIVHIAGSLAVGVFTNAAHNDV